MISIFRVAEHRWDVLRGVVALTLLAFPLTLAEAQESPGLLDQRSGPIVLRSDTRLIVEDVVVTNAAGKPVEGLPESAFHLTDDGHPQSIRSFEESKAEKQESTLATKSGVLSNASMKDSSLNLNVLLIDPIGIELADQMFLRLQALKYLDSMPEGTAMAVFRTSRDGRPLLVQSTTTDRALLKKAINNCVPTLAVSVPTNEVFFNAIGELSNMAEYLGQMRGRKSLIWIAGQFPLAQVLGGNGAQQAAEFDEMREATKSVYRKLEVARVAVSPVDVRGVVNASINVNLPVNTQPGAASSPTMYEGQAAEQQGSWNSMDAIAAATGGHASYSNNGLTEQIRAAVDMGRHFYTLTYSPKPYGEDGQWHKIALTVDGGFPVTYRQGYFAQPSLDTQRLEAAKTKRKASYTVSDAPPNLPVVFEAKVLPGEGHDAEFTIQYAIAAADLSFQVIGDGERQARLRVAALSYDMSGQVKSNVIDAVTTRYSDKQMDEARRVGVPVLQKLVVGRGAKFLLLSVIDMDTGRTGTLQLTLASTK